MEVISSHYGLALYSLAIDENKVLSWQSEVKEISHIFKENTDFIMVLGSAFITLEEREEILEPSKLLLELKLLSMILLRQ